jgi:NADH-quinone oxidoreductase subunit C
MPDAPGLELIAQELNERREGAVRQTSFEHDYATLVVDPGAILDVLRWLRDTPGQDYRFLSSLHASDYLPAEPRFGVHYELLAMARGERIHLRAALADPAAGNGRTRVARAPGPSPDTPAGEAENVAVDAVLPQIDSCVELFPTAEFHEREAYDFFGIVFRGHPDLRRILMPEDYVGWPQRRDFPVGGEPVLFTHNEVEMPRWYE